MAKIFFGVKIKETPAMLAIYNNNKVDILECFADSAISNGAWRRDKGYAKYCIKQLRKARKEAKK